MRQRLEQLQEKIKMLGGDIEEKEIDLRHILTEIVILLDQVLPIDRSDDV